MSAWHHINHGHLAKVLFARSLHSIGTLFFPSLSIFYVLEASPIHTWGRRKYLHVWFGILLERKFVFSSIIYSIMSVWANVYLFYTLSSNPILRFYFVARIFATFWALEQLSDWHLSVCFLSTYFLVLEDAPGSSCIFFTLVIE